MEKHPKHPDEITPQWLTEVLTEAGVLTNSNIKNIKIEMMAEGKAWLSKIVKIEVEYETPIDNAPQSFVIKMLAESRMFREFSYEMDAFKREIRFYTEVAPNLPIRFPKLYYSLNGLKNNLMIMEDLSYLTPGDQVVGMSNEQVLLALESIAKYHSCYWENVALDSISWMPTSNNVHQDYVENWDSFVELCSYFIDPEGLKIGEKLKPHINWLFDEISKSPRTLIHDDMKEDNLLFGEPGTKEAVVILDWQFATRSTGVIDVARLIGGSQTPIVREGHQFESLRYWYELLFENGVKYYSWDEAQRDFKFAALSSLVFPVHFHKGIVRAEGRALEYVESMYSRLFSFVIEIEADSVLP